VSNQPTIVGFKRRLGNGITAAMVVTPPYSYKYLDAATKRAKGLSQDKRLVSLVMLEFAAMSGMQCAVLTVHNEQALSELDTILAKVFPDAAVTVTSVSSRDDVVPKLRPLYDRVFGH